jgi:hypothetical protein
MADSLSVQWEHGMADLGSTVRSRLEPYLAKEKRGGASTEPVAMIGQYLNAFGSKPRYSGRAFETYGLGDTHPDTITGTDLVAVTLLSMQVGSGSSGITPEAALRFEQRRAELSGLLARIDPSRELHELDEATFEAMLNGPTAPGRRLFDVVFEILAEQGSQRWVATHKLVARKRPGLFPIRDDVARKVLSGIGTRQWWRPWWEALHGPSDPEAAAELIARVKLIRDRAGASHLTVLRTLDILIWMRDRP